MMCCGVSSDDLLGDLRVRPEERHHLVREHPVRARCWTSCNTAGGAPCRSPSSRLPSPPSSSISSSVTAIFSASAIRPLQEDPLCLPHGVGAAFLAELLLVEPLRGASCRATGCLTSSTKRSRSPSTMESGMGNGCEATTDLGDGVVQPARWTASSQYRSMSVRRFFRNSRRSSSLPPVILLTNASSKSGRTHLLDLRDREGDVHRVRVFVVLDSNFARYVSPTGRAWRSASRDLRGERLVRQVRNSRAGRLLPDKRGARLVQFLDVRRDDVLGIRHGCSPPQSCCCAPDLPDLGLHLGVRHVVDRLFDLDPPVRPRA